MCQVHLRLLAAGALGLHINEGTEGEICRTSGTGEFTGSGRRSGRTAEAEWSGGVAGEGRATGAQIVQAAWEYVQKTRARLMQQYIRQAAFSSMAKIE
ncbi:MAG: hypothetical protein M1839_008130 [Geoglossum umbratile]|nr:MAG: hypothetical protein M1839_008130 [Geoglossum umbratile]